MRGTEGSVGNQDLVFPVDRSLGSKIVPGLLREAGLSVEVHDDHFADPETPDEDWLRLVGQRGWIGFSADKSIRRNGVAKRAARFYGARLFFTATAQSKSGSEKASLFLAALPRIRALAASHDGHLLAAVRSSGVVRVEESA